MDKKWNQSLTVVGSLGAMIAQTLVGFELMPADANEPMNAVVTNLVEMIRNIFIVVGVYGARRAVGNISKPA